MALHPKIPVVTGLALVLFQSGLTAQRQVSAVPNPLPTSLPNTTSFSFENASVVTSTVIQGTWNAWTFDSLGITGNSAGIARNNAGPAAGLVAPHGSLAAFLTGTSRVSTAMTIPAGIWRISCKAAARQTAGVTDAPRLRILLDGVAVMDELIDPGYASYHSHPLEFSSSQTHTLRFEGSVAGQTQLLDQCQLESLRLWSNPSTWGLGGANPLPLPNDDVRIPTGVVVVLDQGSKSASVLVEGQLVCSRTRSASLSSQAVTVKGAGSLFEVGSYSIPHAAAFSLLLEGNPTATVDSSIFMAMDKGVISMHGLPCGLTNGRSWTWLAAAATANASSIQVAEVVPWKAGDQVVVAGSNAGAPGDPAILTEDQAEVRTITAVSADRRTLTIQPPLVFNHDGGGLQTFGNGTRTWTFQKRAEVGLLTHNVVIEGGGPGLAINRGAHVKIMYAGCCSGPGVGRFSSVHFKNVGQSGIKGRYPLHWHMLENLAGLDATGVSRQYARRCSFQNSFNRAITIHGTESIELTGNVAYGHEGHGIFLEDGVERFNRIKFNLVLGTYIPKIPILDSDANWRVQGSRSPATFWISNPQNEFVGNVAAGGHGTGYWFALPHDPLGDSANRAYFQSVHADRCPLGAFDGNACHSTSLGIDLNDSIVTGSPNDVVEGNRPWLPPQNGLAVLTNFTAYLCDTAIYTGNSVDPGRLRFTGSVLADNGSAIILADNTTIADSVVIAKSGVGVSWTNAFAYVLYDGPGIVENCHFHGFGTGSLPDACWVFRPIQADTKNTNHRFRGISYSDPQPLFWLGARTGGLGLAGPTVPSSWWGHTVLDEDGSLMGTGTAGLSLVADHPMVTTASVHTQSQPWWLDPVFALAAQGTWHQFGCMRIRHPSLGTTPAPHILFERHMTGLANEQFLDDGTFRNHRQCPLAFNRTGFGQYVDYSIRWQTQPPAGPIEIDMLGLGGVVPGSLVVAKLEMPQPIHVIRVETETGPLTNLGTLQGTATGYATDPNVPNAIWVQFAADATWHTMRIVY